MTLPHGFGQRRCTFGGCDGFVHKKGGCDNKDCLNYQDPNITIPLKEKFRMWKREHDEAWIIIQIILSVAIIVLVGTALVLGGIAINDSITQPTKDLINAKSCSQLAEYVADQSPQYNYADHRYEWLCVNEQIKEFQ